VGTSAYVLYKATAALQPYIYTQNLILIGHRQLPAGVWRGFHHLSGSGALTSVPSISLWDYRAFKRGFQATRNQSQSLYIALIIELHIAFP
jgi:hypothetical protein